MEEYEVITRIQELCFIRSWSSYRLAKESGIPYSTLCTMLHKANAPSIPTLVKICRGFGITLSQFFDSGTEAVRYTPDQKELLDQWSLLSEENQRNARAYIDFLLHQQKQSQ